MFCSVNPWMSLYARLGFLFAGSLLDLGFGNWTPQPLLKIQWRLSLLDARLSCAYRKTAGA